MLPLPQINLSIVTPVYNQADLIAQAVESVQAQGFAGVEHIIVDGGSTDGTLEILARYPHLQVVSRPDEGMYFALNDGLRLARGEVVGFLNSDDLYRPGALAAVVARLEQEEAADAVAGRAVYFVEEGETRRFFRPTRFLTPENLWRELTYGDPAFNAWFFRRRVFERLGGLDTSYRIAGDRDFLLRFALAGLRVSPLDQIVYAYRVHPTSLSLSTDWRRFLAVAEENLRLAETYLPQLPPEGRRWMVRAQVRDTITAASRSLRSGRWADFRRFARLGWGYHWAWPGLFVWRLLTGPFRVLGRRLGLRPPL